MNDLDPQVVIDRTGPVVTFEDPAAVRTAPATEPTAVILHRQAAFYGNVGPRKPSAPLSASAHRDLDPVIPSYGKSRVPGLAIATLAVFALASAFAAWGSMVIGWTL